MTRRVVITGMGTVNALSCEVREYWQLLCQGKSGVGLIEQIDTTAFKIKFGGEVKNFNASPPLEIKQARHLDRFAQFAMVAGISAIQDSDIEFAKEDPFRCGAIIGSGIGGLGELEDMTHSLVPIGARPE